MEIVVVVGEMSCFEMCKLDREEGETMTALLFTANIIYKYALKITHFLARYTISSMKIIPLYQHVDFLLPLGLAVSDATQLTVGIT
jgi:hypothetical protein